MLPGFNRQIFNPGSWVKFYFFIFIFIFIRPAKYSFYACDFLIGANSRHLAPGITERWAQTIEQ
ncbi:hypothetical protein A1332_13540 [Methylomonas methanica]|uniref:Uncharacterized protein n=1 Tax=Methylomonas methanica TaxID=421 RepID=A0A177MJ29_METMH|nr:hypothetical protein A1332_13540 [Methylomonas methanica]